MGGRMTPDTAATITDRLDVVSRALSRVGGMAIAAGHLDIVNAIGEAGCTLDDIIRDLLDAEDA
jgi:hypothetical protein